MSRLLALLASVAQSLTLRHGRDNGSITFTVSEHPGGVGGLQFFKEALLRDLPPTYADELQGCEVYLYSNPKYKIDIPEATRKRRIWLVLNGEGPSGEDTSLGLMDQIGAQDRLVILGNWWNVSHENFTDARVSSLWVPFASLSFAERRLATPVDLLHRNEGAQSSFQERHLIAYQQRNCAVKREQFWDAVNEELHVKINTTGEYFGKCNGRKKLGKASSIMALTHKHKKKYASGFDETVDRFRRFKFVVAMEHNTNKIGYVTEKIVNAFLAGAVPIYAGAAQDVQIFNKGSFIEVHQGQDDSSAADRIIRLASDTQAVERMLSQDVISETALHRFFSWHPAVWARTGDTLRRNIMDEVVKKCHE